MHSTLPVYCETFLNTLGTFPAEPVNTLTSIAPVIFGALALLYLIRHQQQSRVAYVLAALTILTGLGSIAWHAMRTEATLAVDALPGVLYFATVFFFWFYYLGGRYLGLIALAGFVALMALLRPMAREEFQIVVVSVLVAIAAGLLIATWLKKRYAFKSGMLMISAAAIAFAFRTLDLSVCSTIPVGTHFFWHIFLGAAAYAGVRMIALLKEGPEASVRRRVAAEGRQAS